MVRYWRKLSIAVLLIPLYRNFYVIILLLERQDSSITTVTGIDKNATFVSATNETFMISTDIDHNVNLKPTITDVTISRVGEVDLDSNVTDIDNHVTFVSATNETFRISTDMHHNVKLLPLQAKKVRYLRNTADIITRGKAGNCTLSSLDVLAWIMNEVNNVKHDSKSSTLMIAYGGLIHIHREKEFVNKTTGQYIDDDVDLWASLETLVRVGRLEPELFEQHGWTMRAFIDPGNYVIFYQLMAACGHEPSLLADKLVGKIPAIEIYGVTKVQKSIKSLETSPFVKDLWMGNYFSESMFYPPQYIDFVTAGALQTLHLQLPNKVLDIMACVYGNWTTPSGKHASARLVCA